MTIRMEIEGADRLIRKLRHLNSKTTQKRVLTKSLKKLNKPFVSALKKKAPTKKKPLRTGTLRRSITGIVKSYTTGPKSVTGFAAIGAAFRRYPIPSGVKRSTKTGNINPGYYFHLWDQDVRSRSGRKISGAKALEKSYRQARRQASTAFAREFDQQFSVEFRKK